MTSRHPRFVTLCQQTLVLGVICAALTPAANVLSLDLVPSGPGDQAATPAPGAPSALGSSGGTLAAYERANAKPSLVDTAPVASKVDEYPLTAPTGARMAPGALEVAARKVKPGATKLISTPQPVDGYGAVGVTWEHGATVPDDEITVKVRTFNEHDRRGGYQAGWSDWMVVDYHDDHGPDPDSAEGRRARPGTDPLLVGDVDQVQVKVATPKSSPADMKLAVIDPGKATKTARQMPAIDTAELPGAQAQPAVESDTDARLTTDDGDEIELAAGAFTPKPVIYSRAQWGANEKMRDKGSLHYYEVHAGFVHHTVNANNYTRAEVPGILRGIYAYHTQSKGWSDVGYNYLVDRFGRIWEGRAGGVDRPVVGAHTLGYNDDSFAMSAIGNYDIAQPSPKMIQAYAALFAWKLSLHGVNAASTKQFVTSRNFQAINGHRDAGSTACPGKYLYAQIPKIRRLAAQLQVGFSGRQLESDVASTPTPDLIARRTGDGHVVTIPIRAGKQGTYSAGKPIDSGLAFPGAVRILNAGDWDRDGHSDMITRAKSGVLYLWRGNGKGKFVGAGKLTSALKTTSLLAAVGDVTGDGWPDLMAQPRGGSMTIYPGRGRQGVKSGYTAYSRVSASRLIGVGLWNGDGAPDVLLRQGSKLKLMAGNGPGGLTGSGSTFQTDFSSVDWIVGVSPVDGSGRPAIVIRSKADGKLSLIRSTKNRTLGVSQPLGSGFKNYDLVD